MVGAILRKFGEEIRMRVLFVTEDLANGGSERVISVLANGFSREHTSAVVAIRRDRVKYSLEKEVVYFPFKDENKGKLSRTFGRVLFLVRAIRQFKPEVVVAFDVVPIVYASLACKICRKKLVVSERANPEKHTGRSAGLYFRAFEGAEGAVFQTQDAKQFFSAAVQSKGTIIPNPINEEFVVERYEGAREKEIVTACRLNKQKNLRLFIDIVSDIHKNHPDYNGIIYGDGSECEDLKAYARENGAENCIRFAGRVDNVRDRIYRSQFYLCTSDFEGISNSMLEAMSLGLNVVSTDCPVGGARMAINSGVNGMLFPVGDGKAAVDAIEALISDPEKSEQMGRAASRICEKWSSKSIVEEWVRYLQQIVNVRK